MHVVRSVCLALLIACAGIIPKYASAEEDGHMPGTDAHLDQSFLQEFLTDRSLGRSVQWTEWGTVRALQGGWAIDRMLVFHAAPLVNANPPCTITTNGYIVNETHSGHNLFNTMLMTALLNRREVALVISGCYADRPQIISVAIR